MSTTITITVDRSAAWVASRRLETGENVPKDIQVPVNPAELTPEARAVLLEVGNGEYRNLRAYGYNRSYKPAMPGCVAYGTVAIVIDSDNPTPDQISNALVAARNLIRDKQAVHEEETRLREEQKARELAEREAREAARSAARELLADEIADLTGRIKRMKDDLQILSEYLQVFPTDAKRGALRKMAVDQEAGTIERLRDAIEDAATVYVLSDLDDEDSDD